MGIERLPVAGPSCFGIKVERVEHRGNHFEGGYRPVSATLVAAVSLLYEGVGGTELNVRMLRRLPCEVKVGIDYLLIVFASLIRSSEAARTIAEKFFLFLIKVVLVAAVVPVLFHLRV